MKAQEFLVRNKIEADETVDARKISMGKEETLDLAKNVKEIYSCRGNKLTHLKKSDKPTEQNLIDAMMGPTGNLRAPTMKIGDVLLVGFNEDVYKNIFRSPAGVR